LEAVTTGKVTVTTGCSYRNCNLARVLPGAEAGAAAAQHPLWGLACGAKGRKRIGDSVPSPLGVLLSLPLSSSLLVGHRPPNFLGLRRSTHFGLACGTEGRKQSKRIKGQASALALDWGSAPERLSPSQLAGHQIFSAGGAAPTLGWPAAQKAEIRASRPGTTPSFRGGG
jgi:hypothetical protein